MPNVRRDCQTADAQPSVTDGDGCSAGKSRPGGEPGEYLNVSYLSKAIKTCYSLHVIGLSS